MNFVPDHIDHLSDLVRELRAKMFQPDHGHERQWESEVEEAARIARNKAAREKWDRETEEMIEAALSK